MAPLRPPVRASLQLLALLGLLIGLALVFPRAFAFVELAALELRYLWWLILLLALAVWLFWASRRPR